jgi:hypothetical protein
MGAANSSGSAASSWTSRVHLALVHWHPDPVGVVCARRCLNPLRKPMPEPTPYGANGSSTGISLETRGRSEQPSFAGRSLTKKCTQSGGRASSLLLLRSRSTPAVAWPCRLRNCVTCRAFFWLMPGGFVQMPMLPAFGRSSAGSRRSSPVPLPKLAKPSQKLPRAGTPSGSGSASRRRV